MSQHSPDEEWISVTDVTDPSVEVRVRIRRDGQEVFITDVHVHADQITNEALRSISISRLRALFLFSAGDGQAKRDFMTGVARRNRLTRPDPANLAEFYQQVAQAYAEYAPKTKAINVAIAREARVPVKTAERWVREARRRGALPKTTRTSQ